MRATGAVLILSGKQPATQTDARLRSILEDTVGVFEARLLPRRPVLPLPRSIARIIAFSAMPPQALRPPDAPTLTLPSQPRLLAGQVRYIAQRARDGGHVDEDRVTPALSDGEHDPVAA